jgi:hypothetical protein
VSAVVIWNLIGLSGAAMLIFGVWSAFPPAGFILGGAVLLAAAVLLSPRGET